MEARYTWTTPEKAVRDEGRHWRSVCAEERLAAVEAIRRATPGIYGDVPVRLERVYRFVEVEPRAISGRRRSRAGGRR